MNAKEFAEQLGQGTFNLRFNKADGNLRLMKATRMSAYIPADKQPKEAKTITENQSAVPVFDLDIKEWRSVRPDSILSMEIV